MAFRETLRQAIDANGGRAPENIAHIAGLARKVAPDFTPRYLAKLLMGFPPRPIDYQALGAALGISPSEFLEGNVSIFEDNCRKAKKFVVERMQCPDFASLFVEQLTNNSKARQQSLTAKEFYVLFHEFLESLEETGDDELS